jgi:hypothetical protein
LGLGHLRGDGPLPNEGVQRGLATAEAVFVGGFHLGACGADRLVGFLGVLLLGGVLANFGIEVIIAVTLLHAAPRRLNGFLRQVDAVGTHVGDVAVFVEPLRGLHRLAGGHVQLAIGFLLQRAGGKRGIRPAILQPGFDIAYLPRLIDQAGLQLFGRGFVEQQDVDVRLQFAGVLIEIATGGDATTADGAERGIERRAEFGGESRLQIPVAGLLERQPLQLALHQHPHGDRLHAAGRQLGRDLLPQQRAERVTVQPVEHAAGFLGFDEVAVQFPRIANGVLDGLLGDFGEDHAFDGHLGLQQLGQMPADAFPLAVFVGGENQLLSIFERVLQFLDDFFALLGHDVQRLELALDVHSQLGPRLLLDFDGNVQSALRQVADVPHAGHHDVVFAEIPADLLRLGGRFDDHQSLERFTCHRGVYSVNDSVVERGESAGLSARHPLSASG